MVVGDVVVMGRAGTVAPGPADGDAGVVEVEDVVVLDDVVRRMADPDAHGRRVQPAAVGDQAVADRVAGDDRVPGGDAGRDSSQEPAWPIFTPPPPRSTSSQFPTRLQRQPAPKAIAYPPVCRTTQSSSATLYAPMATTAESKPISACGKTWPSGGRTQLLWARVSPRSSMCSTQLRGLDRVAGEDHQPLQPRGDDHRPLGRLAGPGYVGQRRRWADPGTTVPARPGLP